MLILQKVVLKGQEVEIHRLYWDRGLSITQIAQHYGVHRMTLANFMTRHNIPRDHNRIIEALRKACPNKWKGINTGDVATLYCQEKLSCSQIAKRLGVSITNITYHLNKAGIQLRTPSEAINLLIQQGKSRIGGKGALNPAWKGGKHKDSHGYVLIYSPGYHRQVGRRYAFEHILVWEQTHGQPLPKGWIIHHLNGIKDDNLPENLVATPTKHHRDFIKALQERIAELEMGLNDTPRRDDG